MPASGRVFDSRLRKMVDSARSVSPWNTGFGKVIFSYPRFPMVVRNVRSGTIIPPMRAAVKRLFTSRRPCGRLALAYSSSRWIGATFIVNDVNSTLSISVTVLVKGCENCAPSSISSQYNPRIADLLSQAAMQVGERVRTLQPFSRLVGVRLVDVDVAVHHGPFAMRCRFGIGFEQTAIEVNVRRQRGVDLVDHRNVSRVKHDLPPETH